MAKVSVTADPGGSAREVQPPITNNLEGAPTIFLDGVVGLSVTNGVAKINLFQSIQEFQEDGRAEPRRVIVGRLAMSPVTMLSLSSWLGEHVKKVESAIAGQQDANPSASA